MSIISVKIFHVKILMSLTYMFDIWLFYLSLISPILIVYLFIHLFTPFWCYSNRQRFFTLVAHRLLLWNWGCKNWWYKVHRTWSQPRCWPCRTSKLVGYLIMLWIRCVWFGCPGVKMLFQVYVCHSLNPIYPAA